MKVCPNCLSAQELSADESYCGFCDIEVAPIELDDPEVYAEIYKNMKEEV